MQKKILTTKLQYQAMFLKYKFSRMKEECLQQAGGVSMQCCFSQDDIWHDLNIEKALIRSKL